MINIASYAKAKSSGNGGTGGGSYSSTINYYGKLSPHYLWGNLFDGSQDITGDIDASQADITAKNVIVKNELDAKVADIIKAYVDYLYAKDIENEGNLSVSGDTSLKNTTITGTLDLNGSESISGGLTVSGDTSLKNTTVTDLLSNNITNNELIKTKDLLVTGSAHFFELIIDKIKAAGGAVILTPADGFSVDAVEEIEGGYRLYFRSDDENGNGIINMWKVNDQALCKSFNKAKVGTSYNVSNKNYWTLVTGVDEKPVKAVCSDGLEHDCHYIDISTSVFEGTVDPEVGDEIVMLGYRGTDDIQRQSAIYISAYQSIDKGLVAPLFAEYRGINDFNLEKHRYSFIDANGATFIGTLKVTNGQTVEDYVSGQTTELKNEFKVDINGLTSRVSKMVNPNILPANSWKDQDDKDLFQKEDEEYVIGEPLSGSQETRIASNETKDFLAYPPVMYLNKGNYTMSVYATAKYKPIVYGEKKDNLNKVISTETMINKNDVWHGEKRSQTTFHAPIDGYYQIGIKMMDSSYSGDTPYIDYDDPYTPSSGDTPSGAETITPKITITLDVDKIALDSYQLTTVLKPDGFDGNVFYVSNNSDILTVDSSGLVTGISDGTATIKAYTNETFKGGKHYLYAETTLDVEVSSRIQTTIDLTCDIDVLDTDDTAVTHVTYTPSYYPGDVEYTSEHPEYVTVDKNGNLKCINGDYEPFNITATLPQITHKGTTYLSSSDSIKIYSKPLYDEFIGNVSYSLNGEWGKENSFDKSYIQLRSNALHRYEAIKITWSGDTNFHLYGYGYNADVIMFNVDEVISPSNRVKIPQKAVSLTKRKQFIKIELPNDGGEHFVWIVARQSSSSGWATIALPKHAQHIEQNFRKEDINAVSKVYYVLGHNASKETDMYGINPGVYTYNYTANCIAGTGTIYPELGLSVNKGGITKLQRIDRVTMAQYDCHYFKVEFIVTEHFDDLSFTYTDMPDEDVSSTVYMGVGNHKAANKPEALVTVHEFTYPEDWTTKVITNPTITTVNQRLNPFNVGDVVKVALGTLNDLNSYINIDFIDNINPNVTFESSNNRVLQYIGDNQFKCIKGGNAEIIITTDDYVVRNTTYKGRVIRTPLQVISDSIITTIEPGYALKTISIGLNATKELYLKPAYGTFVITPKGYEPERAYLEVEDNTIINIEESVTEPNKYIECTIIPKKVGKTRVKAYIPEQIIDGKTYDYAECYINITITN